MKDEAFDSRKKLSNPTRWLLATLGAVLTALLAIAAYLQPDPKQIGTHEQLGLPPCAFHLLFGVPCPTCGMTTSWAHLVRGEISDSFRANAGGAMLALLAIVAVPVLMISSIRGGRLAWMPDSKIVAWTGAGIVLVVLLQWGCRLVEHFHFHH